MEALVFFFNTYGLEITLIAVLGILVLGILKYCNLFSKLEEEYRHYAYLGISIGISIIGTIIYLSCIGQFTSEYMLACTAAIFTLNQVFYNIFKVTPINKLFKMLFDWIKSLFIKNKQEESEDE